MWHAQITELRLRQLASQQAYADREPYSAILTVRFLGDNAVFVESMLKVSGRALNRRDWFEIVGILREQYGVETIEAERHGRRVSWPTTVAVATDFSPL